MSFSDKTPPEERPETELPSEEEAAPEELALGVEAAPEKERDGGMGALEPTFDLAEGETPAEDGSLQAYEPVIVDEDFGEEPSAPDAEIAPPPEEAMRGAPVFSPAAFAEPAPSEGIPHPDMPAQKTKKPPAPEMVKLFLTNKRLEDLWDRVDRNHKQIPKHIQNLYLARELMDAIEAARNELLAGPENYEEAERFVNEVEYRVAFSERLQQWSSTWGTMLFVYEVIWALLFVWWMFRLGDAAFQPVGTPFLYIMGSMVWGGIGGITGALLALIRHITKYQDFDIQHRMWYIGSPIMGMVVGLFIYGSIQVGLLSLTNGNIDSPFIIYILSWLGGYQHNVFTDMVKRMLKAFEFGSGDAKQENPEDVPVMPPQQK